MRTKTLLLTAALSAAGIATSMAQVYSVNAVGYVNTTLLPGFNLISNPLDNKTGNTIGNLFTTGWEGTIPEGTVVYFYNPDTDQFVIASYAFGQFDPPAAASTVVAPGNGVWVNVPGNANQRVTFVGEVPQGSLSNPVPQGFSIKASQVPQAGAVSSVLGYAAGEGDTIYQWNSTTDQYVQNSFAFGSWAPAEPVIAVGEAFFVSRAAAGTWNRSFTVNPTP